MQLAERGKLDLDAPVQKYVPSFPEKPWPITARLLLGHLSGIRHYSGPAEVASTRHYTNLIEPLKIFQNDPLLFEPGTKYSYTSYGFNLLGAAVEAAAGVSFMDYLRAKIFIPAGMERIRNDDSLAVIPNRARGYQKAPDGAILNCDLADTSNKIPGGGMIATAEDLVRLAIALQHDVLVRRDTRQQMFTPQKTKDGKPTTYGLGWQVGERNGRHMVWHGGGQQGTRTVLGMLEKEDIVVAVMCNTDGASPILFFDQIVTALTKTQLASR